MKTAIVLGASGLTGKKLVRLLLADKRYTKIKLLVRTPMDIIYEKIEQIVFDFDNPDVSVLKADEVFCCLGTTIRKAGSKAAFRKVDYDYIVNIVQLCRQNGVKRIAVISSMGANKNALVFYNNVKGETEEALAKMSFDNCYIFRPSFLLGTRTESRTGESFTKFFVTILSFLIPLKYKPIQSKVVAAAMVYAMNEIDTPFKIFESDDIAHLPLNP